MELGIAEVSEHSRSRFSFAYGAIATGERIEPLFGGRQRPEVEPFCGEKVRRQLEPCGEQDTVV